MLERFDLQGAVAIGHFDAHAAARRQRHHLVSREFAFVENVEHFAPDIAGRSDQRDFVTHRSLSEQKCRPAAVSGKGRGSASMRETPSIQRLTVGLTVAFGRSMHSFSADPANSHYTTRIHPALTSFSDEVCATLARLFAYVMTLALLALGFI